MNAAHKIVVLVGSIFLAVGVFVGIIFAIVAEPGKFPLAMLSLPGSFLLIGGGMDIVVAILVHNKKMIVKKGVKYPAKIYGYTENTSVKVNNTYMMDTIVHYFDSYHVEREAIIPTGFTRGAGMYPIGLTTFVQKSFCTMVCRRKKRFYGKSNAEIHIKRIDKSPNLWASQIKYLPLQ